jgi:hypothetical protein
VITSAIISGIEVYMFSAIGQMIDWMQETQGLEDLGEHEPLILDYLAKYYAPQKKGRRPNLENIEWYELEE